MARAETISGAVRCALGPARARAVARRLRARACARGEIDSEDYPLMTVGELIRRRRSPEQPRRARRCDHRTWSRLSHYRRSLKRAEAESEAQRDAGNEWYDSTLYSRLNNKRTGCIILIMQRLHENDLVGHVLAQEGWKHLSSDGKQYHRGRDLRSRQAHT